MEPIDGAWGNKRDDGSWSGMVGQLVADEADFSPSGFAVTEDRLKVVDYLEVQILSLSSMSAILSRTSF